MKRKLAAGLLVPVVFALAAACGGGGGGGGGNKVASAGTGGPSSSTDQPKGADLSAQDEDKMREFAKCVREHGVDMPDPKGGAMVVPKEAAVDEEVMKKAHEACKKHLPDGGEYKEPSQEDKDKMREQAKCMREHGIDMPDPDFSGTSRRGMQFEDTEKFKQAMKDCGMGDGGIMAVPAVPGHG